MRRTLQEKDPHRPSTKLNTLHGTELTRTALHRHTEPPKLRSQLSGDLDWIVMKALEKTVRAVTKRRTDWRWTSSGI